MHELDKVFQGFLVSSFFKKADEKYVMEPDDLFLICQFYFNYIQMQGKDFSSIKDFSDFLTKEVGEFTDETMIPLFETLFVLEQLYFYAYELKVIPENVLFSILKEIHTKTEQVMNQLEDLDKLEDEDELQALTSAFASFVEQEIKKETSKPKRNNVIPIHGNSTPSAVYQLRIDIEGFKPPIWRRVLVPNHLTFDQLHLVIQNIFEWENCHLYDFRFGNTIIEVPSEEDSFFDVFYDREQLDSTDEHIGDWLRQEGDRCTYTYDFGDDWTHKIKLEKIFYPGSSEFEQGKHPVCIKLKGDAPEEDSRFEERFVSSNLSEVNERLKHLGL